MNSEKKHLIQSSISSYESNNKTIAAVPTVIEQSGRGERAFDIYSRLIDSKVLDNYSKSLILKQVDMGVYLRMACLEFILK